MRPQIGIVLGSHNDLKRIAPGLKRLQAFGVPFDITIASAHRTPERLETWLRKIEREGVRVIIAGAGAAAHLPGVVASKTLLPVIGLPFDASPLKGIDALYSIVQMPPGIPVATVGIDSAENAAVLALHILGAFDASIQEKLREYRNGWKEKIAKQNAQLLQEYPPVQRAAPARSTGNLYKLDAETPNVEIIEKAVQTLLGGGVIALPTDTVYGLAVDASNPIAIEKLYTLKQRPHDKAIPLLIDSVHLFRALAADISPEVETLIECQWPGPLTLVIRKNPHAPTAVVSPDDTLGVRMPDDMIALGVISLLGRPIAATSANLSGRPPAATGQEIAEQFGDKIDMILDAGRVGSQEISTILDVANSPYRILRPGAIDARTLKETLGDTLAT